VEIRLTAPIRLRGNKPGLFSAVGSIISAGVALIAVIVSIRIANRAKNTAESANRTAISALKIAEENTKTLFRIERPYITGGGDWETTLTNVRTMQTGREFVVDVKNNGKTPALLTHFFVDFALKAQLPLTPIYTNKYVHYDWIGANETNNGIKKIDISDVNGQPADVIYGAFPYTDFNHDPHCFRFILSFGPKTTHPDIALDKPAYAHWN
jgi:hypothetical protein